MNPVPFKQQELMILSIEWALSTLKKVLAFTPRILPAKIPFQVIQNKHHFSLQEIADVEKTMINKLPQLQGSFFTWTFIVRSCSYTSSQFKLCLGQRKNSLFELHILRWLCFGVVFFFYKLCKLFSYLSVHNYILILCVVL